MRGGNVANEQNLIPNSERTPEELKRMTRNGGIASGIARRRKKTLKEELIAFLETGDTQERVSLALINEAINGNNAGSVKGAFETIRDTIGEKPVEKVEQVNIDLEYRQSIEYVKNLMKDRKE